MSDRESPLMTRLLPRGPRRTLLRSAIAGPVLLPEGLAKLRALDPKTLPAVPDMAEHAGRLLEIYRGGR